MKGIMVSLILLGLLQCSKNGSEISCEGSSCSTMATVVDATGLDGCGFLFELADGSRLDPERRTYIKAPTVEEDPLYHFEMKAGQLVKIDWEESLALNACMAGPIVFITCITECKKPVD